MSNPTMEDDIFTGKMNFALWKKLLRFAWPHKGKILGVMSAGALVSVFDMCLPNLTGRIVDAVTAKGAATNLRPYMLIYGLVVVGFCTCIISFIALAGRITVSVSYDIRQTLFDKLQQLPFAYYDRKAVGWLMARMTSDCSNLSRVMAWSLLDLTWGTCSEPIHRTNALARLEARSGSDHDRASVDRHQPVLPGAIA